MSSSSGDVITRVYTDYRGVDFSNRNLISSRSSDSLNMWKDYEVSTNLTTRPSLTLLNTFSGIVYGFYFYDVISATITTQTIIHIGTKLYNWTNYPSTPASLTELYTGLNPTNSNFFVMNNILFISDGINYLEYDGTTVSAVVGTTPKTLTGGSPSGGGTSYQEVNMLTNLRINGFVGDGESTEYNLNTTTLDETTVLITVDGTSKIENTDFTVNRTDGIVTFTSAPAESSDGEDNVLITFGKTVSGYADRIKRCSIVQTFDNRVFFAGNPNYPNTLFWTELDDARYASDVNYQEDGSDLALIKSVIPGDDALWVIKEPTQSNETIYYHVPTIDSTYGKVYPSSHSSLSIGCSSMGTNFADDIVFLSERGLELISGSITTESALDVMSSLINGKMLSETNYSNAKMVEYKGYLIILINKHFYVADSRQKYSDNGYEYEWYYWEDDKNITDMFIANDELFMTNTSGEFYSFTGTANMVSYWTTPQDLFDTLVNFKTTDKRGGLAQVEPLGNDITILTKTNSDSSYSKIDKYSDENGYIVYRIKKKKFLSLSIKIYSDTRMSLISNTLKVYIGGNIKR